MQLILIRNIAISSKQIFLGFMEHNAPLSRLFGQFHCSLPITYETGLFFCTFHSAYWSMSVFRCLTVSVVFLLRPFKPKLYIFGSTLHIFQIWNLKMAKYFGKIWWTSSRIPWASIVCVLMQKHRLPENTFHRP